MKVKHLIKELQKCDPEMEVMTDSEGYEYDTCYLEFRSEGILITHDKGMLSNYENDQDTPKPLPVTP